MTRKDETRLMADKYCLSEYTRLGFILGAGWADETMIARACEWLEKNVCTAYNFNGDEITSTIIDDFRKAMEGDKE